MTFILKAESENISLFNFKNKFEHICFFLNPVLLKSFRALLSLSVSVMLNSCFYIPNIFPPRDCLFNV